MKPKQGRRFGRKLRELVSPKKFGGGGGGGGAEAAPQTKTRTE